MAGTESFSRENVETRLIWEGQPGQALTVEVENRGDVEIANLAVVWAHAETAPPRTRQSPATRKESDLITTALTPQKPFTPAAGDPSATLVDLAPGSICRFRASPEAVRNMSGLTAALATDQYWMALRTGDAEFARILGSQVATFLEGVARV
jgi:hypothetical protein